MRRWLSLAAILGIAGCTAGRPLGFSAPTHDHWTLPLVGPLEDGALVTPVYIHGHGPYLFAIDPDAKHTLVDDFVVKDAGLTVAPIGERRLDTGGTMTPTSIVADVIDLRAGDLSVQQRYATVVKTGAYNTDGRQIDGVIGHDILQDSVVFGFDRDAGLATLTIEGAFHAPTAARVLPYQAVLDDQGVQGSAVFQTQEQPLPHAIVKAQLGAQTFAMHVALGTKLSQLREDQWAKAGLAPQPAELAFVDQQGVREHVASVVQAPQIAVDGIVSGPLTLTPDNDARWGADVVQGVLGLNFWKPFDVWADWSKRTVFVAPRRPAPAANRIARWALGTCAHVGCVTVTAGTDGTLVVARDPGAAAGALEIVLAPAAAPEVPTLVVNLPVGATRLTTQVPPAYADPTLAVVDESPYPRACPTAAGCVGAMSTRAATAQTAAR